MHRAVVHHFLRRLRRARRVECRVVLMTPRRAAQMERHAAATIRTRTAATIRVLERTFVAIFPHPFRGQDDTLPKKPQANFVPPRGKGKKCEKGLNCGRKAIRGAEQVRNRARGCVISRNGWEIGGTCQNGLWSTPPLRVCRRNRRPRPPDLESTEKDSKQSDRPPLAQPLGDPGCEFHFSPSLSPGCNTHQSLVVESCSSSSRTPPRSNGIGINAVNNAPRLTLVVDPQFVASWSNRRHRPRMRHGKVHSFLQFSQ